MSAESNRRGSVGKHSVDLDVKGSDISQTAGKSGSEEIQVRRSKNSVDLLLAKQAILAPPMTTKVKGLLKGLRYISQIFESNIKEPEMQIGYPTDVKHVAHIGWDGPSVNAPSWMSEYRSSPEFSSATLDTDSPTKSACQELLRTGVQGSTVRDLPELPKPSRCKQSSGAPPTDSPTRESSTKPKQSRRHQSAGKSTETPKSSRRQQSSGEGVESPTKDPSGASKHGRRRKSKGSSGGGSTRSSRSKALSATYLDPEVKNTDQNSSLKSIEEGV